MSQLLKHKNLLRSFIVHCNKTIFIQVVTQPTTNMKLNLNSSNLNLSSAFISSTPFLRNITSTSRRQKHKTVCVIPQQNSQPSDDPVRPKFLRDADDPNVQTERSFLPQQTKTPNTPNDRILAQVRESMERLGVAEGTRPDTSVNKTYSPMDISHVSPFSALIGAIGAIGISAAMWHTMTWFISFVIQHPLNNEIYVVQRLSVVVRTALVCLMALASGISGVTALGLFLLTGRTTIGRIRGEFKSDE